MLVFGQLGGFFAPPDEDIEVVLRERGWLVRPYALPSLDTETGP